MKKLMVIAVALALLLTMSVGTPVAASTVWHVYPDATPGATPIQDAVDTASPTDTIIVHKGIYRERVIVDVANLTIRASGPMVEVRSVGNEAFLIEANGVTVHGFKAQCEGVHVIMVDLPDDVIISNVIISNNIVHGGEKVGIGLDTAYGCKVINNRVSSPGGIGIRVKWSSTGNLVKGNTVYARSDGIVLAENANDNSVIGNWVLGSEEKGISLITASSNNLIKRNLALASGEYDLFWDGSGTGNTWEKNKYKTSNLP